MRESTKDRVEGVWSSGVENCIADLVDRSVPTQSGLVPLSWRRFGVMLGEPLGADCDMLVSLLLVRPQPSRGGDIGPSPIDLGACGERDAWVS